MKEAVPVYLNQASGLRAPRLKAAQIIVIGLIPAAYSDWLYNSMCYVRCVKLHLISCGKQAVNARWGASRGRQGRAWDKQGQAVSAWSKARKGGRQGLGAEADAQWWELARRQT